MKQHGEDPGGLQVLGNQRIGSLHIEGILVSPFLLSPFLRTHIHTQEQQYTPITCLPVTFTINYYYAIAIWLECTSG